MSFVDCPTTARSASWVQEHNPSREEQLAYAAARVRDVLLDAVAGAIERAGLKRSEVAAKLNTTRSAITRLLGSENPTVKSIGEVLWACGVEVSNVDLQPFGVQFVHHGGVEMVSGSTRAEPHPADSFVAKATGANPLALAA